MLPDRIKAESDAGKGTVSLLGGVHGDFPTLTQYLIDLSDVAKALQKAGIPAELFTLGKLGTNKQYYIPWMQATYVMVANKKALSDLPKGADINRLSYGQFFQWAKNINEHYGKPRGRLPGRPDRPVPPLPPGLPDPGLQRPPEHVVQEQVGRLGLALHAAAVEVRPPAVADATTSCRTRCSRARSWSRGITSRA